MLRCVLTTVLGLFLLIPGSAFGSGSELLVRYRDSVDAGERGDVRRDAGVVRERSVGSSQVELVRSSSAAVGAERALERDPRVLYAEPNVVRSATESQALGGTLPTVQASFQQVNVPAAWELSVGSSENTVAVLDSGVELSHPDLAGRLDGGWDFVDDDPVPQDETPTSHGTHVTGVIGAVGLDHRGIAGIDWTSRILPLRVLGRDGEGNVADEVKAIEYAAASGARIANLSLSGVAFSVTERDALAAAEDTLFVVAAGNDGLDVDVTGRYPCALELPNVVCVTAAGGDGSVPSFADTGARSVDLAAPGISIISTIRGGIWASQSGTSMAAPHVTGAAALMAAREPLARPEDLAKALLSTTRPLPAHAGRTLTGGLLDVAAAVTAVQATAKPPREDFSTSTPPDPPAPDPPVDAGPGELVGVPATDGQPGRTGPHLARVSAKLRVQRARVRGGRLELTAAIDARARGSVQITYRVNKRTVRWRAPIVGGRVKVKFKLPLRQRKAGGTVTVSWAGSALVAQAKLQRRAGR
ncbi:S8 family serine peptidase [Solirubrobacter taibaiensis]|nr:S8 family serine peptidase [Solirubrobacter taibaiensis]